MRDLREKGNKHKPTATMKKRNSKAKKEGNGMSQKELAEFLSQLSPL